MLYQEDIKMTTRSSTYPKSMSHSTLLTSSTHSHHIDVFNLFDPKESTNQKKKKNDLIFITSKKKRVQRLLHLSCGICEQQQKKQISLIPRIIKEMYKSVHENQLLQRSSV
jgi:hypothetical protein